MKAINNLFWAVTILGALLLSSCNKILDISQESEVTSTNMWTSDGDFKSAVNGMYAQLRTSYATNLLLWGDLRSNLYGQGKIVDVGQANIMNNTIYRDDPGTDWAALYATINTANLIIKYANSRLDDGRVKKESLANAYFVRAYLYFWIARIWGDAPVLLNGFESDKQDDLSPSRSPVAEVLKQVEADILLAEGNLTADMSSKSKCNAAAVQMLKAEYYLWMVKAQNSNLADLAKADKALDQVIASGSGLLNRFSDVFDVANENNSEIIWSINFQRDEYVGGYPALLLIPNQYVVDKSLIENPIKIGSAQQYISLTDSFNTVVNANTLDSRRNVSVMNVTENGVHHRWINKFAGEWTNATRFFSSNLPLYRMAEAYLMKAEVQAALGNTTEAVKVLNIVAKRAYSVANYYPADLTGPTLTNDIIDEYLKEFVAEGKSWFVLVRNKVAFKKIATLSGKESKENILLWPVSSAAINTNPNIVQTKGYN